MTDITGYIHAQSVTVRYSDDDMRCDIFFNGKPTAIYGLRDNYDDPFRVYIDRCPDSHIFTETKGWGMVGGISMILDAIAEACTEATT